MIRVEDVSSRIEANVADLVGRMGFAGEFSDVIENNQLPQVTPAGFVLPGALQGGAATAATGIFRQDFRETVIVVLVVRVAGDALGGEGVDELAPIIRAVVQAVCGWGPDDAPGIFVLGGGELIGSKDGAVIYHLEFNLDDQLRITP